MTTTIITVPGFHGSGARHWQSWLETQYRNSQRLTGIDWETPRLFPWASTLEQYLEYIDGRVLLIGHSFGALVSALVASWRPDKVAGLILVAPASPERFSLSGLKRTGEDDIQHFLPQTRIDTIGLLIGSETDPWLSLMEAKTLSNHLGLAFFNAGKAGHINTESGFGPWPMIKEFTDALIDAVEPLPGDDVFHLSSWNNYYRKPSRYRHKMYGYV